MITTTSCYLHGDHAGICWSCADERGRIARREHGVVPVACPDCGGKGQVVIGVGLPGDEQMPGGTRIDPCDRCDGRGGVWRPA